ncbi:MAG: hypothetical protein FWD79_08100 [Desulfobulbus sp.]|nr:hypothetical protein [Desulfobulbus sp.]
MTIDPACNYCPQYGGEYRAEIRICADCGLALVSGAVLLAGRKQRAVHGGAIGPLEPVAVVHRGPVLQVKMLRDYLGEKGVWSRMVREAGSGCGCRGPEVLLQVRQEDQDEAMAILAQEYRESTGLDDHDACCADALCDSGASGAVCPACGCRFAPGSVECPDCGLRVG